MKKILVLLKCIVTISLLNAGFSGDTLVKTPKGLLPIRQLKIGDQVSCFKYGYLRTNQSIQKIAQKKVAGCLKITMSDGSVLRTDQDAKFYVTREKKWQLARDLRVGQGFLQHDMGRLKIKKIEKLKGPQEIFDLQVAKYHNFYVSNNALLVHNVVIVDDIVIGGYTLAALTAIAGYILNDQRKKFQDDQLNNHTPPNPANSSPTHNNVSNDTCYSEQGSSEQYGITGHMRAVNVDSGTHRSCDNPNGIGVTGGFWGSVSSLGKYLLEKGLIKIFDPHAEERAQQEQQDYEIALGAFLYDEYCKNPNGFSDPGGVKDEPILTDTSHMSPYGKFCEYHFMQMEKMTPDQAREYANKSKLAEKLWASYVTHIRLQEREKIRQPYFEQQSIVKKDLPKVIPPTKTPQIVQNRKPIDFGVHQKLKFPGKPAEGSFGIFPKGLKFIDNPKIPTGSSKSKPNYFGPHQKFKLPEKLTKNSLGIFPKGLKLSTVPKTPTRPSKLSDFAPLYQKVFTSNNVSKAPKIPVNLNPNFYMPSKTIPITVVPNLSSSNTVGNFLSALKNFFKNIVKLGGTNQLNHTPTPALRKLVNNQKAAQSKGWTITPAIDSIASISPTAQTVVETAQTATRVINCISETIKIREYSRKIEKSLEDKLALTGSYLSKKNMKRLDNVLVSNNIKLTNNRRLRLQKELVIEQDPNFAIIAAQLVALSHGICCPDDITGSLVKEDLIKSAMNRDVLLELEQLKGVVNAENKDRIRNLKELRASLERHKHAEEQRQYNLRMEQDKDKLSWWQKATNTMFVQPYNYLANTIRPNSAYHDTPGNLKKRAGEWDDRVRQEKRRKLEKKAWKSACDYASELASNGIFDEELYQSLNLSATRDPYRLLYGTKFERFVRGVVGFGERVIVRAAANYIIDCIAHELRPFKTEYLPIKPFRLNDWRPKKAVKVDPLKLAKKLNGVLTQAQKNGSQAIAAPQAVKLATDLHKLLSDKKANLKNATRVDPALFRSPHTKKPTVIDRIRLINKLNDLLPLKGKPRSKEPKQPQQTKVAAGSGNPEPPSDSDSDDDDEKRERKEKKRKTIEDILRGAKEGKKTGGRSKIYEKDGDFNAANEDFDDLELSDVIDRGNGMRTGTLPDGRIVTVRPNSSGTKVRFSKPLGDGEPTLEIQVRDLETNKVVERIKIRYMND